MPIYPTLSANGPHSELQQVHGDSGGHSNGFSAIQRPELLLWPAATLQGASCAVSGPPTAPTLTPDRPALTEPQVLQFVLQRIPSETNRQGLQKYARLEYLGRGEWWPGAMDRASEGRFADLSVVLPCCGVVALLNDLRYEWPAGCARFVLEAMHPGVPALSAAQVAQLEQLVGCPLRVIRAHY